MTEEAKKVIDNKLKILEDNKAGKNICLISRGEWSDPQFAYHGYLLNYWDVESLATPDDAPEGYELTDEDIHCGCIDSLFGYAESEQLPDKFSEGDVFSVTRVIEIKP